MTEEKATNLVDRLLEGKAIHDKFAADMKEKLFINGQLMKFWEEKFHINIPMDNLTPPVCRQLDLTLLDFNQEVGFYHAVAAVKQQMLQRGHDSAYRDKFFALVQEYKNKGGKLPAAATLENLAKVETDDIESATAIAEMEKDFWSNILGHLSTCRKIIENATMNSNIEARLINRQ